jgi:hypothetical protein
VKSTADWNVRTGGSAVNRFAAARRAICACRTRVRRSVWRAPLIGKDSYLNGLNSGRMLSHAALAKAGRIAGQPAIPAKRANRVMPIIGASSTTRAGRARRASSMASSAYCSASAPPFE